VPKRLLLFAVFRRALQQQRGVAEHGAQHVVEVMRDAAGQRAEGLQPLALALASVGQASRRDGLVRHDHAPGPRAFNQRRRSDEPAQFGGRMTGVLDLEVCPPARQHFAQQGTEGRRLGGLHAAGRVTHGQIVATFYRGSLVTTVAGAELAPSAVDPQHGGVGGQHAHMRRKSIERAAQQIGQGIFPAGSGSPQIPRVGPTATLVADSHLAASVHADVNGGTGKPHQASACRRTTLGDLRQQLESWACFARRGFAHRTRLRDRES
jgi:hypothetical protein